MTSSPAQDALRSLREGNARFVGGALDRITDHDDALRQELTIGQSPIAVVLSCSDSRVAPSVVFDQRLGDLFTIRVAGNVTPPEVVGSIEYAVSQLGTRLVVVVGHTGCGAVQATLQEMERPTSDLSPALRALTDRIRPAVERARSAAGPDFRPDVSNAPNPETRELLDEAMRGNVRDSVECLTSESLPLRRMIEHEGLRVLGAQYSLETGIVDFYEGE